MNEELHNLFLEKLNELYSVENQIVGMLPKLIDEASNQDLKDGLSKHLDQTREQITRLEKVGEELGEKITEGNGKVFQMMLSEGERKIKGITDPDVKDSVIIAEAQGVEHFEIAAYGTVMAWAKSMGHDNINDILDDTLKEEKEADKLLSKIAEGGIFKTGVNEEASDNGEDTDEDSNEDDSI